MELVKKENKKKKKNENRLNQMHGTRRRFESSNDTGNAVADLEIANGEG